MSISSDLQAVISRVSVAAAGGATYGKTELGGLVRELRLIRDEALDQEKGLEREVVHVPMLGSVRS